MSKRKQRISQYKQDIDNLKKEAKELLSQMTNQKSIKEFQIICDKYNRTRAKVYVLEKKIGNLENYKHELGTGDEFGFLDDITTQN